MLDVGDQFVDLLLLLEDHFFLETQLLTRCLQLALAVSLQLEKALLLLGLPARQKGLAAGEPVLLGFQQFYLVALHLLLKSQCVGE